MDSYNLNKNVCRICLDSKVILDWDEEIFEFSGISYKDCYCKYTQLYNGDSDIYPTNLCEICADELKNAHFLFEKAMESFNILRVGFKANEDNSKDSNKKFWSSQPVADFERHNNSNEMQLIEIVDMDNELTESLSYDYENESTADFENSITDSRDISTTEDVTIEPVHFIDIQNLEPSAETLLEQNISKSCDVKMPNQSCSKKFNKIIDKYDSVPKTTFEVDLNNDCDATISKQASNKRKNIEKNHEYKSETPLEENQHENSERKSLVQSTTNNGFKTRKKYILMCQYCYSASFMKAILSIWEMEEKEVYILACTALKVNGTNQLKKHEATHSENRKRTETCPKCGVKLYNKMALKEHMKVHEENRQKKYKCEFCEKAFFNKGALNVHRRIHLGLMVKCQLCPKEFFRQIDLDKHLLRHSVSPLQKNFGKKIYVVQCEYCNKPVLTTKWKEHIAAHMDQPQMKCKICDKKFFSRSKCTKHLKQAHRKTLSEYEEFIHYFVDRNARITNLRMKQQLKVQPLTE